MSLTNIEDPDVIGIEGFLRAWLRLSGLWDEHTLKPFRPLQGPEALRHTTQTGSHILGLRDHHFAVHSTRFCIKICF